MTSWITQYRKKINLSQAALAEKLALEMNPSRSSSKHGQRKQKSTAYLQKRISELEAGYGTPTPKEISGFAKVFGVGDERIMAYIRDPGGRAAVSLFEKLLASPTKSLMLACYSGTPRIPADPDAVESMRSCLRKNLSFAMCVPYPNSSVDGPGGLALSSSYQRVRARVFETYELLCKGLPDDLRAANIGVFEPCATHETLSVPLPPFFSRYALVAQEIVNSPANLELTLYLWVETAETRSMQTIGGMDSPAAQMQIEDWRAYFYEIVDYWADHKILPDDKMKRWARVATPGR